MKMQMIRRIAASAAALTLCAAAAHATVLYDNGGPLLDGGGHGMTLHNEAEDFSFATATTIGGAGVYVGSLYEPLATNWDGGFQYMIYADTAGAGPGALLTSGSVTPTVSDSGVEWFNGGSGDAYLFQFNFATPFTALANTTYWLGVHAANDYTVNGTLYFASTAFKGVSGWSQVQNAGPWQDTRGDHAFFLTDGVMVPTSSGAVPEPAAWALMITGFGLAGAALRRRRTAIAAA